MAPGHHREGSGEPLVLLHGGGSTWHEFKPLRPILAPERDVIAIKAPGHYGAPSLAADASLTVPDFADSIERELDGLGLRRVDIAGHSFGAWQALELASRGRARSVVAIAPPGGWTQEDAARTERKFTRRFIPGARRARAILPMLARSRAGRRLLLRGVGCRGRCLGPADTIAFVTALGEWPLAPRIHEFLADPDGRYRTADRLPEVACPVLLLWGSGDKVVPFHQSRYFTERLPDVELRELHGLGHFPHFDEPELIGRAILDFSARAAA